MVVRQAEAFAEVSEQHPHPEGLALRHLRERLVDDLGADLVRFEQARQTLLLRLGAGDEEHVGAGVAPFANVLGHRGETELAPLLDALGAQIGGAEGAQVGASLRAVGMEDVERLHLDDGAPGQPLAILRGPQVELLRGDEEAVLGGALRRVLLDLLPGVLHRHVDLAGRVDPNAGVGRQVREHRLE